MHGQWLSSMADPRLPLVSDPETAESPEATGCHGRQVVEVILSFDSKILRLGNIFVYMV